MVLTETKTMSETGVPTSDGGAVGLDAAGRQLSSVLQQAPALSRRGLTTLLICMCTVPIVTVLVLHFTMPPVIPNSLSAECGLLEVPPERYYERDLSDRLEFPEAAIVVKNTGDQPWTHLNIRINNGVYQIYEHKSPLEPGQEREFLLNRFVHRSGAEFQVGINRPFSVEIYARLPDHSRGTYESELD